ncbi:MAG: hypothetical protein SGPRY_012917, partial [Prymnesium sp.]
MATAEGEDPKGVPLSAKAGEYPTLFSATVAALLDGECPSADKLVMALRGPAAERLHRETQARGAADERAAGAFLASLEQEGRRDLTPREDRNPPTLQGDKGGRGLMWKAAPDLIPNDWSDEERATTLFAEKRAAALQYVSRRRADPEREEVLARRPLPQPPPPPRTEAPSPPAEAVAIVKAQSVGLGLRLDDREVERVALWAIDLSDAYRMLAVSCHELWLQCFAWSDGIRLDRRALFGSPHVVQLFQRISTFILAVAKTKIEEHDRQHPYEGARAAWLDARAAMPGLEHRCSSADIHLHRRRLWPHLPLPGRTAERLDQRSGACDDNPARAAGEGGSPTQDARQLFTAAGAPGDHQAHLQRGGLDVVVEKIQLGWSIDLLGFAISSEGEGRVFVPEAERQGMLIDIDKQINPASSDGAVPREEVEAVVGRVSHLAAVAAEGNAYVRFFSKGTQESRHQEGAARWIVFPEPGEPGCAFLFSDAAIEAGTGFGGFSFAWRRGREGSGLKPTMFFMAERWDERVRRHLQANRSCNFESS